MSDLPAVVGVIGGGRMGAGIAQVFTSPGDRLEPPRLLRDKVARGELGRRTGEGFFTW